MNELQQSTFAEMAKICSHGGQIDVVARIDGKNYRWQCDALADAYKDETGYLSATEYDLIAEILKLQSALAEAQGLLAKACVLEVGAIGEVGDLYYDKYAMIAFPLDKQLIAEWNCRPDGKIIQRNNLPVIYRDKGASDA